ncbi:MAG TPA: hypothetical protein PLY68_06070 [Myxococcota bacterium]|nr:hypothetical protein [Myxococcota bacterium]HQP95748.1 hypothetical protein [Myxococcota bacterium]
MALSNVVISADVGFGETGVSSDGGFISGILARDDYSAFIDALDGACASDPVPDALAMVCNDLPQVRNAGQNMFDIHAKGDGTFVAPDDEHPANAVSFCVSFTMAQASIVGFMSEKKD